MDRITGRRHRPSYRRRHEPAARDAEFELHEARVFLAAACRALDYVVADPADLAAFAPEIVDARDLVGEAVALLGRVDDWLDRAGTRAGRP